MNEITKKAFDSEYATQWRREVEFLLSRELEPTFVKPYGEYKIPTYKYRKCPELFLALYEFYTMVRMEKASAQKKAEKKISAKTADKVLPIEEAIHTTPAITTTDTYIGTAIYVGGEEPKVRLNNDALSGDDTE